MVRRLTYALLLAAVLVAGLVGYALADIPDATPSSPDPSHTMYLCVRQGTSQLHAVYVLDKTQGNCPAGWDERYVVPAIPAG
jgi:hypothetical protein